jgi:hypothetical protein
MYFTKKQQIRRSSLRVLRGIYSTSRPRRRFDLSIASIPSSQDILGLSSLGSFALHGNSATRQQTRNVSKPAQTKLGASHPEVALKSGGGHRNSKDWSGSRAFQTLRAKTFHCGAHMYSLPRVLNLLVARLFKFTERGVCT